jgi:hypothetical protein
MTRATAFLGLALFAVGCGGSTHGPTAEKPAGKPADDEARTCVLAYLTECGWKNVELANFTERPDVPAEAHAGSQAWAFVFTARYTNVMGERQTSENWVAVLGRSEGKPCVQSCFDNSRRQVGGHTGAEPNEKGTLVASAPADDLPPIVPPKP